MLKIQYSGRGEAGALAIALALAASLGWAAAQGGGFYQVTARGGAQWLMAPDGGTTLLLGADHIHLISASAPQTDLEPAYVDQRAAAILAGLRGYGFNTLGGDTDADIWHRGMPYVENLDISLHLQADQQTPMVDVYAEGFAARVQSLVEIACGPRAADPALVGYLSDDGLGWDPGRAPAAVLAYYLRLPLAAPGRARAVDYLRDLYGSDIAKLDRAWGLKARDFLAVGVPADARPAYLGDAAGFGNRVLARYLQTVADAIHAADPNHLYLGADLSFPAVAPAAGADTPARQVWTIPDVASASLAAGEDPSALLARLRQATSRPLLLEVRGCGATAPQLARIFAVPALVGFIWSPAGDWQGGACAAQASAIWMPLNQQAVALHRGKMMATHEVNP